MEEQRSSGWGDSSSTSLHESPMTDPSLDDPTKLPLPSFGEIAWSLTRGQPPRVTIEVPQELTPPSLLVGPAMTMLMLTRVNQDEATGITYVDMVTASMGLVALWTSCMAVHPGISMLKDVTDVTNL